jgi:NTE family protein
VDVLEMTAVTFDSYKKEDGSGRSEYTSHDKRRKEVIKYDEGISLRHVMASASVPGFYDYTKIKAEESIIDSSQSGKTTLRYFWDGAILSNTPLREVIQGHRDYWTNVEKN